MVRISGGRLRGRVLQTPTDLRVRPTTGRVRESLFAMLGSRLVGAKVLDLFAGSGLLGMEALSRGGAVALFVEQEPNNAALIRHNLKLCGVDAHGEVVVGSVGHSGLGGVIDRTASNRFGPSAPFDVVFMDPPYGQGLLPVAMEMLSMSDLLRRESLIVAEHEPELDKKAIPGFCTPLQNRHYGDTHISFWQWNR